MLPESINMSGKVQHLYLPDEHGIKVAFVDLLLDDCYGCSALSKSGDPVNTILDIGANVGLFGIAARHYFPSAKIHAYEPNFMFEKYLKVQANSAGVDYYMEAVGKNKGRVNLDFNPDSVQSRSSENEAGSIPQITLREALDRIGGEVDLLKMDCEGAEWEMFADTENWKRVRNLSMEYHL